MKSLPSRGLPARTVVIVVVCIAVLAAIPIAKFLRTGFGTTGSSIAPAGPAGPPPAVAAALEDLRRRIAAHPNDIEALTTLSGLYAQAGKTEEALSYERRADHAAARYATILRGDPKNVEALYEHGRYAFEKPGMRRLARAELSRFLQLASRNDRRRRDVRMLLGAAR